MYIHMHTYVHIYICVYSIHACVHIYIYIYIYIYINVVPRVFLGIPVHISNVYSSETKGLKGPHHSWELCQKNLELD